MSATVCRAARTACTALHTSQSSRAVWPNPGKARTAIPPRNDSPWAATTRWAAFTFSATASPIRSRQTCSEPSRRAARFAILLTTSPSSGSRTTEHCSAAHRFFPLALRRVERFGDGAVELLKKRREHTQRVGQHQMVVIPHGHALAHREPTAGGSARAPAATVYFSAAVSRRSTSSAETPTKSAISRRSSPRAESRRANAACAVRSPSEKPSSLPSCLA